jgi:hypothetical protein
MPSFRKLNLAEIAVFNPTPRAVRATLVQEYDAYLADVRLVTMGSRAACGHPAALAGYCRRRGLALPFRSDPGSLTFRVAGESAQRCPRNLSRPHRWPLPWAGAAATTARPPR